MSKTYKDKPDKYREDDNKRRPKEKRFESTKGRKKENIKKNLEDYYCEPLGKEFEKVLYDNLWDLYVRS